MVLYHRLRSELAQLCSTLNRAGIAVAIPPITVIAVVRLQDVFMLIFWFVLVKMYSFMQLQ